MHNFINNKWQKSHDSIKIRIRNNSWKKVTVPRGITRLCSSVPDPYLFYTDPDPQIHIYHWIMNPDPDPDLFFPKNMGSGSGKLLCRIHANLDDLLPPLTWNRQRRRCRITGIIIEAVSGAAALTHHHPLGGGGEGDRTLLDQLLHGVVRVEDVLLDELERAGPVGSVVEPTFEKLWFRFLLVKSYGSASGSSSLSRP